MNRAWDELMLIQREQQRYSDIKLDLAQDLEDCKQRQKKLEDVSCAMFLTGKMLKGLSFINLKCTSCPDLFLN